MIHDLLLALVGFTGDLVEADPDTRELALAPLVKLETFDKDIVDGILALGSFYLKIREWTDSQLRLSLSLQDSPIYLFIIAKTLDEEILTEYEEDIALYEEKLIALADVGSNGGMTLSGLRLELWDRWWAVFELISSQVISVDIDNVIDRIMHVASKFRCKQIGLIQQRLVDCFVRELISWGKHGVIGGGSRSQFFVREVSTASNLSSPANLENFQIDRARVPSSLIDFESACKILFCGKTVSILKNGVKSALVAEDCEVFSGLTSLKHASDIIKRDIEKLRSFLSGKLGQRMKREMSPGLIDHLKNIRAFFLMGCGEKWASFVASLFVSEPDRVPMLFQDIFGTDSGFSVAPDSMELKYSLPWPMEIIIDPSSTGKYNEIFALIFKVFAASVKARSCFNMQLNNLFLSILSYIQLDLIEASFTNLLKLAESDDIQFIAVSHGLFLNEVHTGCLVGVTHVWDIIDSLISLNDRVLNQPGNGPTLDPIITQTVKKLIDELEILQSRTMYASIERLVLKLDYNRFYRRDANHPPVFLSTALG